MHYPCWSQPLTLWLVWTMLHTVVYTCPETIRLCNLPSSRRKNKFHFLASAVSSLDTSSHAPHGRLTDLAEKAVGSKAVPIRENLCKTQEDPWSLIETRHSRHKLKKFQKTEGRETVGRFQICIAWHVVELQNVRNACSKNRSYNFCCTRRSEN